LYTRRVAALLFAVLALVLVAAGCGGGGSNSGTDNSGTDTGSSITESIAEIESDGGESSESADDSDHDSDHHSDSDDDDSDHHHSDSDDDDSDHHHSDSDDDSDHHHSDSDDDDDDSDHHSDSDDDSDSHSSGPTPSKAVFIGEADRICSIANAELSREVAKYAKENEISIGADASREDQMKVYEDVVLPSRHRQARELAKLTPPAGDEDQVEDIIWLWSHDIKTDEARNYGLNTCRG
jgi:hypothetical protein